MDRQFKISVVMPVYNVEAYLEESVESIVEQSIGFENIQLILVNDGSKDGSDEICKKYKEQYPENIVYVNQENAGVSAARNAGLSYVKGEIVNFLDSDDLWEKESFQYAYDFFRENKDVDVATSTIEFFEARTGLHVLNYRMKAGKRVADLNDPEEYKSIVVQVASSFFRADAVKEVEFKSGLKFGEDSLFVNTVILKKMKVGFIPETIYYYRKRNDGSSAVQISKFRPDYFLETVDNYHAALMNISEKMQGSVVPYIQQVVYYDLAWRFRINLDDTLNEQEKKEFKEKANKIMQSISDEVILRNSVHTRFTQKAMAYEMKYGRKLQDDIVLGEESKLMVNDVLVANLAKSYKLCKVNFLEIQNGKLIVEGYISRWLLELKQMSTKFAAFVDKKTYYPHIWENNFSKLGTMEGPSTYLNYYRFEIPVKDFEANEITQLKFGMILNKKQYPFGLHYGKFAPYWSTENKEGGYKCFGEVVCVPKDKSILVQKSGHMLLTRMKKEYRNQKALKAIGREDVASFRRKYLQHRVLHKPKKEIWLLSDRVMRAGDNGEVLFKYLNSIDIPGVQPVFAISKDSECVPRLQKEGKVVFFESEEYKYMFLDAAKIISSGASEFTLNPFEADRKYYQDLFQYKFFYLQHGVACADLSSWLRRDAKNIEMIFATSERERNSFLDEAYGYGEDNIVVTGQGRFDDLYDKKEKHIIVLPTWRKSIKESYDSNTTSIYFDGFKDTEFFKFYNGLINHPRLLEKMRECGYKGTFCLHPIHMEQWVDFEGNDVFNVNEGYVNYNDTFAKAALTLTDYSSVIFDFAYLRKYIVYAQFDKEAFFENQTYDEGYFSYEKDGFGPVCYDMESTVDALIAAIENGCEVPSDYLERINQFFAYSDKKNCARIYEAIMEHEKKENV